MTLWDCFTYFCLKAKQQGGKENGGGGGGGCKEREREREWMGRAQEQRGDFPPATSLPQMVTTAGAGPGHSQELPLGLLCWR